MRSPAFAFGWQLWWRHRWELTATAAYILVLAVLLNLGVVETLYRYFGGTASSPVFHLLFGAISLEPLFLALGYLLFVFCYSIHTDLTAPGSGYPARMFTLPVPTHTLVLWPLLHGCVTLALGWVVVAAWILQPCGFPAPLGWPALALTAFLAWFQAAIWWPFGLRGARLLAVLVELCLLGGAVQAVIAYDLDPLLLACLLAGLTVVGSLVAFTGVARARRGEAPDWHWLLQTIRQLSQSLPRRRKPFASARGAQVWFEWRRHGLALPLLVTGLLPFSLLPHWLDKSDFPLWKVLLFVLLLPLLVAGVAGTTVSGSNPEVRDYYGLPPFTAVRPMTCGALIAAKVKMAALSTLAAWGVLLVVVFGVIVLTGSLAELAGLWDSCLQVLPAWRVVGLLALGLTGLIVVTWKQFVANLFIGLTGNAWVINGIIVGGLILTVAASLLGVWIYHHPEYHEPLLRRLPWVISSAVVLKLLAAWWALDAFRRRPLVRPSTLAQLLVLWLLSVLGLFALFAWLVPTGSVPLFYLAMGVVLFLPLARLLAAPLGLAWNRHR
jgi:hypothetical protein